MSTHQKIKICGMLVKLDILRLLAAALSIPAHLVCAICYRREIGVSYSAQTSPTASTMTSAAGFFFCVFLNEVTMPKTVGVNNIEQFLNPEKGTQSKLLSGVKMIIKLNFSLHRFVLKQINVN